MTKIIHFFVSHPRVTYYIAVNLRCDRHLTTAPMPTENIQSIFTRR